MMRTGAMRYTISIQQRGELRDDMGQPVETWVEVLSARAAIDWSPGREAFAAAHREGTVPTVFRIRYPRTVSVLPQMRVVYNARVFDIKSAVDPDGRREQLVLTAEELVDQQPEAVADGEPYVPPALYIYADHVTVAEIEGLLAANAQAAFAELTQRLTAVEALDHPYEVVEPEVIPSRNMLLHSDNMVVAPWLAEVGGVAPTRTADQVLAPDGTLTAERVDLKAINGQYSIVYQGFAAQVLPYSGSIYLRSAAGTPTVYLSFTNGVIWHTLACALSVEWQRFLLENKVLGAGTWYLTFGFDARDPVQPDVQNATTIYAWRAQVEAGVSASDAIQSGATAGVRQGSGGSVFGTQVVATGMINTLRDFECQARGRGLVGVSPNGTRYRLTFTDAGGTLVTPA